MNITLQFRLKNADQMSIGSLADLAAMVPERMTGEALNYGQGEGQLRIGRSVWGFYVTNAGDRSFTLEEGVLSFEEASAIAIGIIDRVRSVWGSHIQSEVRGCHHDDPEMRMMA